MADMDFAVAIEDIHERVESAGVDFHRDDGGVGESLCELAGFGALTGAVVDDGFVVSFWDGLNDRAARGVLDAE